MSAAGSYLRYRSNPSHLDASGLQTHMERHSWRAAHGLLLGEFHKAVASTHESLWRAAVWRLPDSLLAAVLALVAAWPRQGGSHQDLGGGQKRTSSTRRSLPVGICAPPSGDTPPLSLPLTTESSSSPSGTCSSGWSALSEPCSCSCEAAPASWSVASRRFWLPSAMVSAAAPPAAAMTTESSATAETRSCPKCSTTCQTRSETNTWLAEQRRTAARRGCLPASCRGR